MDYHNRYADRSCYRNGHWQLLQRYFRVELAGLWSGVWYYQSVGAGFGRVCVDAGTHHFFYHLPAISPVGGKLANTWLMAARLRLCR